MAAIGGGASATGVDLRKQIIVLGTPIDKAEAKTALSYFPISLKKDKVDEAVAALAAGSIVYARITEGYMVKIDSRNMFVSGAPDGGEASMIQVLAFSRLPSSPSHGAGAK